LLRSRRAIAEAAYKTTVQAGGKNQKSLTVGWEVLGLDRATAERIFKEEAKEGFVTEREAMYGLQTQKYDKKGRRLDKEGSLENPEEADGDDASGGEDGPISNVYECSDCGYTLFVAKGRESKFFGQDFKCPECGAKKDKFKARDDLDE
jgi:rubrerythrin